MFGAVLSFTFTLFLSSLGDYFTPLWLILGGITSLRAGILLYLRCPIQRQGFIVAGLCIALHLLIQFYLKYSFADFVERVDTATAAIAEDVGNAVAGK
jgi:hypothetical protein